METKIYVLKCPDTNEIRYVGKTIESLNKRLSGHITKARYNRSTHVSCWIYGLLQENKLPIIKLIELVKDELWEEREQYWIAYFDNLCNHTIGGECGTLGYIPTQSHKDKLSQSLKGKIRPLEVRLKISNSHKGKILSEITKEKLRQCNLGKKQTIEQRLKTSKSVLQIDPKNNMIIKEYSSISAAAQDNNCLKGNISSACTGRLKTYKGFVWKHKN